MITRRCKIVSQWWINPGLNWSDPAYARSESYFCCSCLISMAFVLMMMPWPMSVPPPGLGIIACMVWCLRSENREASLQGGRKRNYPSSSGSCLRKHKTVILGFCCQSKHPSRRFQSQAINKMGKPKTGKECREEEEERSGHGCGVTKQWIFTIMFGLQMWDLCVGVKKRGGAIHPPQKQGNKSQSENKLEGFTKYGAVTGWRAVLCAAIFQRS